VADDNGYGWAIAKSLAAAGAEILVGTWVPVSKSILRYKISFFVCLDFLCHVKVFC
jgi:enoyl-[acyl-carrier-protein] reductase (NADH)